MIRSAPAHHRRIRSAWQPLLAVVASALPAAAADLPPALVARFTREVQPLLLNRCAAGACHGGPRSHAPQFHRGPGGGSVPSGDTLANAATFRGLLGPDGDPGPLARRLSAPHPATASSPMRMMPPLAPRDRIVLEGWLLDAHRAAGGRPAVRDPAVEPVGHVAPAAATPPPNRFRTLLDTGAPPESGPPRPPAERVDFTGILDRRSPPADGLTPAPAPPSPPPRTADSPPARPDDRASPGPSSTGSR